MECGNERGVMRCGEWDMGNEMVGMGWGNEMGEWDGRNEMGEWDGRNGMEGMGWGEWDGGMGRGNGMGRMGWGNGMWEWDGKNSFPILYYFSFFNDGDTYNAQQKKKT